MQGLQVELILCLFPNKLQIRPKSRLGNRLGVVVIVLLALDEGLDVDRRNNPRFVAQFAKCTADEMRTQTSFHANNTGR